jgi:hypothetical protein
MTGEDRHSIVGMIDGFYLSAKQNGETNSSSPWTITNVCKLVKYVALDDIFQLWGCYLTTKIDPSIFVEPNQAAEMAYSGGFDLSKCKEENPKAMGLHVFR